MELISLFGVLYISKDSSQTILREGQNERERERERERMVSPGERLWQIAEWRTSDHTWRRHGDRCIGIQITQQKWMSVHYRHAETSGRENFDGMRVERERGERHHTHTHTHRIVAMVLAKSIYRPLFSQRWHVNSIQKTASSLDYCQRIGIT